MNLLVPSESSARARSISLWRCRPAVEGPRSCWPSQPPDGPVFQPPLERGLFTARVRGFGSL